MNRDKQIIRTSIVGIVGNVFLVIGKIIVGLFARSVSIITDAVNNLTDALSSIVTIIGTKISNKKPDKKHPYGHGRAEFITSSVIAMLIFVAGFMAIYESITTLIGGEEPSYSIYSFIIISLAIVVKIGLGLFFRARGKKANSDALRASGLDALLDSVLSLGTLVCAIVSYTTNVHLEGYVGIAIGLFIIKSAVDVFRESISKIIGERTDASFVKNMVEDIQRDERVYGVYDLIINNYGTDRNIGSVHVEVDDNMTAKDIQRLEREIGYVCYDKYHTIMTVGVYARNAETPFEKDAREKVVAAIGKYPEIIQTHGFFVDEEKKIMSVDVIVSFEAKDANVVCGCVKEDLMKLFPEFSVQVVLDRDFSVSDE